MNINDLYELARNGSADEERAFLIKLTASFRLLVGHKIWNKEDAEEAVQDIIATIAGKYKNIEFEISFSAWAHKVMENKLLHYYRCRTSLKVQNTVEFRDGDIWASEVPDPTFIRQLLRCLQRISRTNQRYARVLNLSHQGFSAEEICQRLKVTRNNVFVILSRARSLLKHCLDKGDIK